MATKAKTKPAATKAARRTKKTLPNFSTLLFEIPEDAWQDNSDTTSRAMKRTLLYASVSINGTGFHCEAFEVRYQDDELRQEVVNENLAEKFEAYLTAGDGDGSLETMTIGGREYVVFLSPFC